MRTLVLMRGSPGCGKTTWIQQNGLSDYALSADKIRGLFASPELRTDGSTMISQRNDKIVWETLFQMLERRMQRGDFTIIDACNSKTSEMTRYKNLAQQYRYRIYCVDMTDIPIEETLKRNRSRSALQVVPEEYIQRVYSRFETQQIPSGITRVAPDELDAIFAKPFDLSEYDRVVHIGDIHGCYDAIQRAFGEDPINGIDPNTAYIFLGDYVDRGPDSPSVIKFLIQAAKHKNVCLLEGNHERHLWDWANNRKSRSREFELKTKFQLEAACIDKSDVRQLYRRFRQCSYYTWRGKTVMCTHGGLPRLDGVGKVEFIPASQMISGVGQYEDVLSCAESFERYSEGRGGDIYQVFGHRNIERAQAVILPHSFILENDVEHGGTLRVATLSAEGWDIEEFVSDKAVELNAASSKEVASFESSGSDLIATLVSQMRESPLINEKQFGHISSFNFTRSAFADKKWNDLTVRARGLYIDTQNNKIAARGYEKFFMINERPETKIANLSKTLQFPIEVFQKENGFLGLLSYDRATGTLFATTKSSLDGDMAVLFRSMLSDDVKERAENYLKENDVTLLFEVVHPTMDPHIIEYSSPQLFLLDVVRNTLDFSAAPYDVLEVIGRRIGVDVKKRTHVLNTWGEFMELYSKSQNTLNSDVEPFEGYVIRDASGYMFKIKTDYYSAWKYLRGVSEKVYNYGYIRNTSYLTTPLMNYYYAFIKDYYTGNKEHHDIITLRKLFEQSQIEAAHTRR